MNSFFSCTKLHLEERLDLDVVGELVENGQQVLGDVVVELEDAALVELGARGDEVLVEEVVQLESDLLEYGLEQRLGHRLAQQVQQVAQRDEHVRRALRQRRLVVLREERHRHPSAFMQKI